MGVTMHEAVMGDADFDSSVSSSSSSSSSVPTSTPYKKEEGVRHQKEINIVFKMTFSQNIPFLIYDDKMVSLHDWLQTWLLAALTSWNLHTPRLLLLLLLFSCHLHHHHPASAQETCSRRRTELQIRYKNCAPRLILARACLGHCHSYTKTNRNYPLRVDRLCRCCRQVGFRLALVRLRCPAEHDPRQNDFIFLRVRIPRSCRCRPCAHQEK